MDQDANSEARTSTELLAATKPFASEIRAKSWTALGVTLGLVLAALCGAAFLPWWPLQLASAVVAALALVRAFILYHDYMHGAILRKSKIAKAIMHAFGVLFLAPPAHWRKSHNYHHAEVGTLEGSDTGTFPIMTTEQWRRAKFWKRAYYRVSRHPLTILFAYVPVFLLSNCLLPGVKNPRKEWSSGLALLVHAAVITGLWLLGGFWTTFWVCLLPYAVATAMGAYLFYAQHNYPGMRILPPDRWNMGDASLASCSFMKLGPVMNWFTGSIGYHHVHHLNASIPFYRLKEAMKAIPEAQNPVKTTLRPWDVYACLRLKIWDEAQDRMVSYREARRQATNVGGYGLRSSK